MRLEDVLELLHSLVRTLRENASVKVIMCGLLYRTVILCHNTVVTLMVTDVVMVAVGGSVSVAVGKVIEGVLSACQDDCQSIKVDEELYYFSILTRTTTR